MDLNIYLERNIIEFLERKATEKNKQEMKKDQEEEELSKPDKDYEGLLYNALQKENHEQAKSLFAEAKEKLTQAKSEEQKETYTNLIEKLFFILREHKTTRHEDFKSFQEQETADKNLKETKEEEKKNRQEQKQDEEKNIQKIVVEVRKGMEDSNKKIAEHLKKKDFKSAMKEYDDMKNKFDKVPDVADEKKELFKDLISCYSQIKKLEKAVTKELTDAIKKNKEKRKKLYEETKEHVLVSAKKIKVFLKDKKFKQAMLEYNCMKKEYDRYPFEYKTERKIFYKQLIIIYESIKKSIKETYHKKIFKDKKQNKDLKEEENPEIKKEREIFQLMVRLKEDIKAIIELMKESQLDDARVKLLEAKHDIEMLPDEKEQEKKKFEHIISEIGQRMNFLEHATGIAKQDA